MRPMTAPRWAESAYARTYSCPTRWGRSGRQETGWGWRFSSVDQGSERLCHRRGLLLIIADVNAFCGCDEFAVLPVTDVRPLLGNKSSHVNDLDNLSSAVRFQGCTS